MTLKEIAQKLNLSVSTVSRALSRPEMVAEETRDQILEAATQLGYQPNGIARYLRKGTTQIIGIIVSDIQNPFYSSLVRAVEGIAAEHGYSTVICNADEDPTKEAFALDLLAELKVAGVIHGSTGLNEELLRRLSRQNICIVDVDRVSGLENADTVLVDNTLGGRLAAEYLLELGHRRLAVIAGPLHLTTGHDRLEGFRSAIQAAGQELPDDYVRVGNFREDSGFRETMHLLQLPVPPTALFVANNEMAAGALAALREYGARVPETISFISFDDVRWARYVEPPLTVIKQPVEQIGTLAAKLLFERLQGRSGNVQRVLSPELICRNSCAPPKPTPHA